MERLPDRPASDSWGAGGGQENGRNQGKGKKPETRKEKMRKSLSTYIPLVLVVVALFFLTADEPAQLEHLQDVRTVVTQDEDSGEEKLFVVGTISEDGGRFSKGPYTFDESTGVVEIRVRQYQVSTIFGSKEFVAYIKEDPNLVKEVWLIYDDGLGDVKKEQVNYIPGGKVAVEKQNMPTADNEGQRALHPSPTLKMLEEQNRILLNKVERLEEKLDNLERIQPAGHEDGETRDQKLECCTIFVSVFSYNIFVSHPLQITVNWWPDERDVVHFSDYGRM